MSDELSNYRDANRHWTWTILEASALLTWESTTS